MPYDSRIGFTKSYDALDCVKRHAGRRVDANMKRVFFRIVRNVEREYAQPSSNAQMANSTRMIASDYGMKRETVSRIVKRLVASRLLIATPTRNPRGGTGTTHYTPIPTDIIFDDAAAGRCSAEEQKRRIAWFAMFDLGRTPGDDSSRGVDGAARGAGDDSSRAPVTRQGALGRHPSESTIQRAAAEKSNVDEIEIPGFDPCDESSPAPCDESSPGYGVAAGCDGDAEPSPEEEAARAAWDAEERRSRTVIQDGRAKTEADS